MKKKEKSCNYKRTAEVHKAVQDLFMNFKLWSTANVKKYANQNAKQSSKYGQSNKTNFPEGKKLVTSDNLIPLW